MLFSLRNLHELFFYHVFFENYHFIVNSWEKLYVSFYASVIITNAMLIILLLTFYLCMYNSWLNANTVDEKNLVGVYNPK